MTTPTPTASAAPVPAPAHLPHRAARRRPGLPWTYWRVETLATLRRADTLFFTILMPLGMYLLFGKMSDFQTTSVGHGNVTAAIMVNMSVFSAAIAATSIAASAAVEQAGGWGRQVALTAGGLRSYVLAKLLTAVTISIIPAVLIFAAGALTGATIDSPERWAASFVLSLVPAVPFACFGLAAGLWVPSNTAVGVASASVSIMAFLGNVFMPLSGVLFTLAHWTPLYGPAVLAQRPLTDGVVASMTDAVSEPLWYGLANLVGWTTLFLLLCAAARRRSTVRS